VAHPDLEIIINGGIATLEQAQSQLAHVDGRDDGPPPGLTR